jgi:signal transduction histidine kinase
MRRLHLRRSIHGALGLRARATLAAAAGALLVAVALSVIAYLLVRGYLLDQREKSAARQTFANARVVRDVLRADDPDIAGLLSALRSDPGGFALVHWEDQWYSTAVGEGPETLPARLLDAVGRQESGRQRYTDRGETRLAVAVGLPSVEANYVEVFPLSGLKRTLTALRTALIIAAVVTAGGGALLGWWATRRVLRPLTTAADAATTIAAGHLDVRMDRSRDPDLDRLATSFDEMATSLQARIEREARFASDVSHELRTPLAALAAAADVLDRRRDEIPTRSQQALDILLSQLRRFDRMTLDLLEISRLQAAAFDLHPEDLDAVEFVTRVAEAHGYGTVPVETEPDSEHQCVRADKRVLERVLHNLLENARVHGEGVVRVAVAGVDGTCSITVEDAGPGIAPADRDRIFERFARGRDAGRRPGSGLGLALVSEHVRLLGGNVRVEDRPGGGARFRVELPSGDPA